MSLTFSQNDIDFFDILTTLPTSPNTPGQIAPIPNITVDPLNPTETPNRGDVRDYIRGIFEREGLPASLADWAYDTLVEGASTAEMTQRMYDRPEFRDRFQALFKYRELNPHAPAISPSEVLAYERQAAQIMASAGMPPGFYDQPSDFVDLIANNKSIQYVAEVVQKGFERVQTAPRMVREAFASFFGPSGDSALAAFFLDPTKALPALRQQVAAAEAAGAGFNFGFTIGKNRAMDIAAAGFDFSSATDRFAGLARIAPLFDETMAEANQDLTVEDQGAASAFGLEGAGTANRQLEQRRDQRVADFSGAGGVTGSTRLGARGLGSAR